ncbi:HAD family hydrolase [Acutalibacter sp. 1XD8-33]|uniref:HAD family hydrolase n=1 Tax=Acutalibacter sp. 1XD8-33 TaxID=2320081 RepID=UPI000EA1865F|nr:HAD family hydrolase [Acutalibacter sp. 1XD8-33]RKJ40911.1 HAD family hydrolase [Acutalibacter sp. 1XD8-33]
MKIQAVFFDIDNTLLWKRPSIPEKVHETLAGFDPGIPLEAVEKAYAQSELWQGHQVMEENRTGVRMLDEEFVDHVAGVYRDSLGLDAGAFQTVAHTLSRDYRQEYSLAPGALEVLDRLKEQGIVLGIVSNHHTGIRAVLEEMGIARYFHPVVISEEVGVSKPDAAILELACARAGASPEDCLYVGDHPFDILCAHAAHMPVVWLPVNRFMEVPEFIGAPEYTASSLQDAMEYILNENEKG